MVVCGCRSVHFDENVDWASTNNGIFHFCSFQTRQTNLSRIVIPRGYCECAQGQRRFGCTLKLSKTKSFLLLWLTGARWIGRDKWRQSHVTIDRRIIRQQSDSYSDLNASETVDNHGGHFQYIQVIGTLKSIVLCGMNRSTTRVHRRIANAEKTK